MTGKAGEVRGQGRLELDAIKVTNHPVGSGAGGKVGMAGSVRDNGQQLEEEGTRVCRDQAGSGGATEHFIQKGLQQQRDGR